MGVLEGVVVPYRGGVFFRPAASAVQLASSPRHPGPLQILSHFNGGCFTIKGIKVCFTETLNTGWWEKNIQ